MVLTASGVMRGTKPVLLKKIVDDAVSLAAKQGQPVTQVLCLEIPTAVSAGVTPWNPSRDVWWHEAIPRQVRATGATGDWRRGGAYPVGVGGFRVQDFGAAAIVAAG